MNKTDDHIYNFCNWGQHQFLKYKGCVAYIASKDANGDASIGTCFHVGNGVFVTARHVIEFRNDIEIQFDDDYIALDILQRPDYWVKKNPGNICISGDIHFHQDSSIDVACFKLDTYPEEYIPLGEHLDCFMDQYALLLHRTLIFGYPPIPMTTKPVLVSCTGEINALVDTRHVKHRHFIVSSTARGGFSGGPALVAYNQMQKNSTALLGIVTSSFGMDNKSTESGYMAILTVEPIYDCLDQAGLLPEYQKSKITADPHIF